MNVKGSIEAELLSLLTYGAKELVEKEGSGTIASGNTSSNEITVHSGDLIVIKAIEVSGVTPSSVVLKVDGKEMTLTKTGDLEANYGAKLYGRKITAVVNVASAVGSDTSVTVKIYGYKPK